MHTPPVSDVPVPTSDVNVQPIPDVHMPPTSDIDVHVSEPSREGNYGVSIVTRIHRYTTVTDTVIYS